MFTSTTSRTHYTNGVAGTANTTNVAGSISDLDTTIFGRTAGGGGVDYVGNVCEVACWNVALDAVEMAALANWVSPLLIRPTGLIAYWPIIGKYDPEIEVRGRRDLTVNGAPPAIAHTKMSYPSDSAVVAVASASVATKAFPSFHRSQRFFRRNQRAA